GTDLSHQSQNCTLIFKLAHREFGEEIVTAKSHINRPYTDKNFSRSPSVLRLLSLIHQAEVTPEDQLLTKAEVHIKTIAQAYEQEVNYLPVATGETKYHYYWLFDHFGILLLLLAMPVEIWLRKIRPLS
ncbi:MAG: hypothetical protein OXC40_04220, partial [Proteobacteria bacterium]|nr:hypothetical protein [Pseudomonadota bacterium]